MDTHYRPSTTATLISLRHVSASTSVASVKYGIWRFRSRKSSQIPHIGVLEFTRKAIFRTHPHTYDLTIGTNGGLPWVELLLAVSSTLVTYRTAARCGIWKYHVHCPMYWEVAAIWIIWVVRWMRWSLRYWQAQMEFTRWPTPPLMNRCPYQLERSASSSVSSLEKLVHGGNSTPLAIH